MLRHLQIRNFAIVPTLDLDIRRGFTAITGETGAGKSIMVDALGLLLGDRSDAGWVRSGADRAELSAEFSVENNLEARQWLDESELSANGLCLLRRTINASGRSRAFINGTPVTIAQMQSLGDLLVEIHGQNEHLRLTKQSEQFRLLDNSGDYQQDIESVGSAYTKWQSVTAELNSLDKETLIPAGELEFLKFQLDELKQHDLDADAINELQIEHDRLAVGGALLDALNDSLELLEPEADAIDAGINADIHSGLASLQKFIPLDADIDQACQMLQEASVNCSEAVNALRSARDRLELNPDRFDRVANTLSQLHELARKHRVGMLELKDVMESIDTRIERADSSEHRRLELLASLESHLKRYRQAALSLHTKRQQHAAALSARVSRLMAELGMEGGTFELSVSLNPRQPPGPRGDDSLQINISANLGLPPGPLSKIASGGELSRISLAIKVAAATNDESVTQVFDEVDAGIGGDTANAVGRLLKRLAGNGQALCVTHLAQVAVCAKHQLQVQKSSEKESTVVETRLLDSDERVIEVARMLSGKISQQSRAHAIELLASADQDFIGRT